MEASPVSETSSASAAGAAARAPAAVIASITNLVAWAVPTPSSATPTTIMEFSITKTIKIAIIRINWGLLFIFNLT